MAEAIVDGAVPSLTRFFCHQCSVEIEHLLPDFTCPRCSTGFIEELERENVDNNSGMDATNDDLSDQEVDVTGLSEFTESLGLPFSFIRAAPADNTRSNSARSRRIRRQRDLADSPYSNEAAPRNTSSRNQQQQQQANPLYLDSFIQDFFVNLAGIGIGIPQGQGGQPPVFDVRVFLNPGDYVWGQNGLDSIVTQLLNQMDGTGPPPLPKKLIDEIPTTAVSQTQVESKLQCSVCWEDFVLSEPVRQLPCLHHYHAPCIVPWLELHGTCPICRQSLGDQTTSDANQDTVGPSLAALFRAANESSSSRTSSASFGSSSRNDSPNEI